MAECRKKAHCPACGKAGVVVGLGCTLLETVPTVRPHACRVGGPGASGCDHEWLDRPESDSRECLICGEEVFGG